MNGVAIWNGEDEAKQAKLMKTLSKEIKEGFLQAFSVRCSIVTREDETNHFEPSLLSLAVFPPSFPSSYSHPANKQRSPTSACLHSDAKYVIPSASKPEKSVGSETSAFASVAMFLCARPLLRTDIIRTWVRVV